LTLLPNRGLPEGGKILLELISYAKIETSRTGFTVDCAIDIQREFHRYNSAKGEPIHIRIGLDCGEPVEDSNDFFGATVQLAARLCATAESDQILISDKTFQEYDIAGVLVHGDQLQTEKTGKRRDDCQEAWPPFRIARWICTDNRT
jgi:hypothetical protein